MISENLQKALNAQIQREAEASHLYLAMASWCDKSGMPGAAKFLYAHSEEERGHMLRLFKYVNDSGSHAIMGEVPKPQENFESLMQVFEQVFEHEKKITKSINELVQSCLQEGDYSTFNFLQWYVAEQHEEEHLFQSILDKIKILGDHPEKRLFWLDREIGQMTASK